MELGSGVGLAGMCISGGAVAITAIRTFAKRNSSNRCAPCKDHSGIVVCLENIEKNQDRQERWLGEIAADVKEILQR